jgi:hypothetical protein
MKRDNTNPIYLNEFLSGVAGLIGVNGVLASGAKYGRMAYNTQQILKAYPTPDDLKRQLLSLNKPLSIRLASRLDSNMSKEEYYKFVQRYLCNNTMTSWIIAALMPGAILYQGAKGLSDMSKTAKDKVIDAID